MPTLGDVIKAVSKQYDIHYEKTENEDEYNVTIVFQDERSQLVTAFVADDEDGKTWVAMTSPIGSMDDLDANDLLERNASPGFVFVAVEDGVAMACTHMPIENVDTALAKRMLFDVAAFADSLEEELVGGDDA